MQGANVSMQKSHAQLNEIDDNSGINEGSKMRESSIDFKRLEMSPSSPNFRAKKRLQGVDHTPTLESISDDAFSKPKGAMVTTNTNQLEHAPIA
jgi:hypothetical protein